MCRRDLQGFRWQAGHFLLQGGKTGGKQPAFLAPFFNVTGSSVCLGNAALTPPEDMTFSKLLEYWEKRFWLSEFSHSGRKQEPDRKQPGLGNGKGTHQSV